VEHSAARACARARLDDYRDEPVREAAVRDRHRADERLRAPNAWDAWAGARRDAAADVAPQRLQEQRDAGAGKLAGRARDVQGPDASLLPGAHRSVRPEEERAWVAEPCRLDAGRFGARSCAAQEAAKAQAVRDAVAPPAWLRL